MKYILSRSFQVLLGILLIAAATNGSAQNGIASELVNSCDFINSTIVAQPCKEKAECTYTWTVTSRLGDTLKMAQELLGPRDKSYTILGIEFITQGPPSVWYPGNRKDIIIQLTTKASCDMRRALFQLAHETVHILSPTGGPYRATILEEGLATYFSLYYLEKIHIPVQRDYIDNPKYQSAYDDIVSLTKEYPDALEKIKNIRKDQPFISGITYEQLKQTFPKIGDQLAQRLTMIF
jgi:hypothetical protein